MNSQYSKSSHNESNNNELGNMVDGITKLVSEYIKDKLKKVDEKNK